MTMCSIQTSYLKYHEFLDRAQTDCQKEGYKIFYDRSNNPGYKCHRLLKFMGLGIQVHLIANHNDYYIKFIVNLQKVLVADGLVKIINESNAQEAIEMVNWQLSSWLHTNRLAEFCKENHPKMAVLCIPKSGAKEMVQKLLDLGVNAFWNFSHYDIHYDHPEAAVENVHLTDSLMTLSYAARRQEEYSAEPSSEEENTEE